MSKLIDRTGETNIATNGMKIEIIGYRSNIDMDIRFEDGTVVSNKRYNDFLKGRVEHPLRKKMYETLKVDRIGDTVIACNGMKMTIINYRNNNDVDVQFEDGAIAYNKIYKHFLSGYIAHPLKNVNHIGETQIAKNGMKMTIIKYKNNHDIDIEFEDGAIVKNKIYKHFLNGYIAHPSIKTQVDTKLRGRVGDTNIAKNGLKMTIIKYDGHSDIDIQFEDGVIVKNKKYGCFLRGNIKHPTLLKLTRINKVSTAKNGMKMTIIDYRGSLDIDVKFEDGKVVKNKAYRDFLIGNIRHPSNIVVSHINETVRAANGLKMKIIKYANAGDIDVQFEDGCIIKNRLYHCFSNGYIAHPKYSKCKHVGTYNNEKLFICTCKKCKNKHVLKLSEMKDFKCNNTTEV